MIKCKALNGLYFNFTHTEALSLAGMMEGLSSELALEIAIETMAASAALLKEIKVPSLLKERVTSPKGTTQAALSVFSENNNLANLIQAAVESAVERSRELSY